MAANPETQALLQRLCTAVETLVAKSKGAAEDAECTCGAEEGDTHHKKCPMRAQRAEDMEEDFRAPTPSRSGGGAELIPVPSGGNSGTTNPVAQDQYLKNVQALDNLRALRPAIVSHARQTGDRSGIESFNLAVSGLQREIALFEKNPQMRPYQTSQRAGQDDAAMRQKQIAVDFDAAVARAREAAMNDDYGFPRTGSRSRAAFDAAPQPKEDIGFDEQVRRAREMALSKK